MNPKHTAFHRKVEGASKAVLFIHGICGSPYHFRDLYSQVPQDWTIESILLQGHGGSALDFGRASMARWREQAGQAVDDLAARHSSLLITGHSMGTLLAIDQALQKPDQVKGLFLLAVPLRARATGTSANQAVRAALDLKSRGNPSVETAKSLYGIDPDRKVWRYLRYISRYNELLRFMKQTREAIPRLQVPSRVLMSRLDEIVSAKSASYLTPNPMISLYWLEDSDHKYYPPEDKAFLLRDFAEFCRKLD